MTTRRVVRSLLAACLLGALAAVAPVAPGMPSAGAWSEGPCPTADGVTIVVDFQELGGGIWVRCAPGTSDDGFESLQRAGIPFDTTTRFAGFLCRIDGKPASDPCQTASPASAYWSYWMAPRGGTWCYSSLGGGNRNPAEGTVEGWSFSLNRTSGAVPAPRYAPPAWIPGAPTRLPGGECNGAATAPTAPPATAPSAPPTTARPIAPRTPAGIAGGGATGGATTGGAASGASNAPASTTPGDQRTIPADVGAATTVAGSPSTTDGADPNGGDGDDGADGDEHDTTVSTIVTPDGEEVAVNAPGSSSSSAPTSSPVGVIVALVLIAALSATSFVVRRRTRAV